MKLSDIVASFMEAAPAGMVLGEEDVTRMLRNAVRFYAGYATLRNYPPAPDDRDTVPVIHTDIDAGNAADGAQDFDLTLSEWAIIKPLFDIYVERENAVHLEASRGLGVDVFGRTVSEIQVDVNQREMDLPKAAFMEPPVSI